MNNVYLEKIASYEKSKRDDIHGWKRAGTVAGTSVLGFAAGQGSAQGMAELMKKENPKSRVTNADVKSYVRSKNLRHVDRYVGPDIRAHYAPPGYRGLKRPTVLGSSPEIVLHEYGHAHSVNQTRKKFGSKGLKAKMGSFGASNAVKIGAGMFAGSYAATSDNEKVRKYAPVAVAAASAPLLVEEARATLSPTKHLLKTRGKAVAADFLKKMGPSYGTYLATAAGAIGAASWAKHVKNKAIAKANKAN